MEFLLLLIVGIVLVIVLVRLSSLSARLDEAMFEIKMLKGLLGQMESQPRPAHTAPPAGTEAPLVAPPAPEAQPAVASPPSPEPAAPPSPPSPLEPPPPPKPPKSKEEWEALIGGRLLNRIGALALILGVGFFLKYAFDRDWITEWVRVLIGITTGGLLLLGAARSQSRGLVIFAQGLVGAGIAILYLSVYASFNYYALVSQPVAFAFMGAVTLVAFLQAFRYDSLAVSLLGWMGGFLTPFLLSTGEVNAPGLFTYIALLDAGILAVLLLKPRWLVLEPLTIAATYTVYFLWYGDAFGEEQLAVAVFFLVVFWLLFHGLDLARTLFSDERPTVLHRLLSGTNALVFSVGIYLVIDPLHHAWMGAVAAVFGLLYALSAIAVSRKRTDRMAEVVQHAVTAMVLVMAAAEIQFEDLTVIAVYALEILLFIWIGLRHDLRYVRLGALAALGWAVVILLLTPGALLWPEPETFSFLWSRRVLAYLAVIATTAAVLVCARRAPRGMSPHLVPILHGIWVFLAFLLITTEINDLFRSLLVPAEGTDRAALLFQRGLFITAAWSCFALPLTWAGQKLDVRAIRLAGIIVLCLAALQAITVSWGFTPIEQFVPVLNIRFVVLALVGGACLWQALWLRRKDRFSFGAWLHLPWIMVWFFCCTVETLDTFRHAILFSPEAARDEMAFLRFMTLGGVWVAAALPLVLAGARTGNRFVHDGGMVIALLGTALALMRGIAYDPVSALVPVLNGRFAVLVLVILMLVAMLIFTRRGSHPWTETLVLVFRLFIIGATLVLITGEVRDYFEHAIALLPEEESGQAHHLQNLQQMLLSSAWLAYSVLLMGYGLWRRTRALRIAAMVLFGVAILKIFIYDLSFLDTLYRIVSFVGLGVILLGVSYLYQRYRSVIFDANA